MLTALSLPESPDELLAGHARALDEAYRDVGGRLAEDSAVSIDDEGRLQVERLQAMPEPPSLVLLRRQVNAMLPRVDLPEVILEVMSWEPRFVEAFTAGGGLAAAHRRDALRRAGAQHLRPPQPQVLRSQAWCHLAQ